MQFLPQLGEVYSLLSTGVRLLFSYILNVLYVTEDRFEVITIQTMILLPFALSTSDIWHTRREEGNMYNVTRRRKSAKLLAYHK